MSKITKISTIYKKERENNPEGFKLQRDKFLESIVNSKPRMNVKVTVSSKSF